ncbi:chromosome segregation protein SMC, partial [Streptomyces nanshensis]
GAAADAVAVRDPATAAAAIRLLRDRDAGRAAMLLAGGAVEGVGVGHVPGQGGEQVPGAAAQLPVQSGAPGGSTEGEVPGGTEGGAHRRTETGAGAHGRTESTTTLSAPAVTDLITGPAPLLDAVRRLVRDAVVVDSLEDAEALVAARPEVTAVTGEGDVLSAHFAHGGSAGAPSLLEVQASVDEAAAELAELAVRCDELAEAQRLAGERRKESAALVEELGERRRAAEREKSGVAQQLGRLSGQARAAAGEAERMTASAARAQEALERAVEEAEELAERLLVAQEAPVEEEPDTSVRDRLAADGANARQTEMEARLQARTHEERVKGLAGRADGLDRAARAERE